MPNSKPFVERLSEQSQEFVIIGLTGKVRSGTSDVARLLRAHDFRDYATQPANTVGEDMSDIREHKVIYRYLHHKWKPFIELSVTSVIVSFILESKIEDLYKSIKEYALTNTTESLCQLLNICLAEKNGEIFKEKVVQKFIMMQETIKKHLAGKYESETQITYYTKAKIEEYVSKFKNVEELIYTWEKVKDKLQTRATYESEPVFFCYGVLPAIAELLEEYLGKDKDFTGVFQYFGNNIRAYGHAVNTTNLHQIDAKNLIAMPERLNQFIKVLRHFNKHDAEEYITNPIFIVINNFKNIFEALYFRRRYSAFYLMAISCDEKSRIARFENKKTCLLADLRENLASAKRLYKSINRYFEQNKELSNTLQAQWKNQIQNLVGAKVICKTLGINETELEFSLQIYFDDNLRRDCYTNNLAPFILQDVMTCIENADIFITRNFQETDYKCDYPLVRSLARMITLILHPALLTPTKIERCMQIAMTAKLNSGCLSRQVGAVVTDSEYNILSLGWNDAPCGVESCIRRNLFDLLRKHDHEAYSEYELNDETFRLYMEKLDIIIKNEKIKENLLGLPGAFCFKDIYQDIIKQRDQIYTRALHGEERALAACGNDRTKGGYLFTTSSPCELCAKKAKEANISKIYYIEQYPGISHTHVIDAGPKEMRAEYQYFVGAVGQAYSKLYTPLLPYKDELAAFGFEPKALHDKDAEDEKNRINRHSESKKDIFSEPFTEISNGQIIQIPK